MVPKLVFQDTGEREILRASGLVPGLESRVLTAVGLAELAFGVLFLTLWRARSLFLVNAALLVLLALGAAFSQPRAAGRPVQPADLEPRDDRPGFRRVSVVVTTADVAPLRAASARGGAVSSIYRRALGAEFDRLHPQMQRRLGVNSSDGVACVGRGVMDEIWHGPFYVVPFLYLGSWRRILFPDRARDVPFTIENYAYVDRFGARP